MLGSDGSRATYKGLELTANCEKSRKYRLKIAIFPFLNFLHFYTRVFQHAITNLPCRRAGYVRTIPIGRSLQPKGKYKGIL